MWVASPGSATLAADSFQDEDSEEAQSECSDVSGASREATPYVPVKVKQMGADARCHRPNPPRSHVENYKALCELLPTNYTGLIYPLCQRGRRVGQAPFSTRELAVLKQLLPQIGEDQLYRLMRIKEKYLK